MQALEQHIAEVGLDVLLESSFFQLLRRLGDHQLVLLVASLGSENASNAAHFSRWLAAYRVLGKQITPQEAAAQCESAGYGHKDFYVRLFAAADEKHEESFDGLPRVHADDLEFGVDFLIDALQPQRTLALLRQWIRREGAVTPWLKTCRKILERQETTQTRALATKMAKTLEDLIRIAPRGQEAVVTQLYAEVAEFWVKARKGQESTVATSHYLRYQKSYSPNAQYLKLRSQLLMKDLSSAVETAGALISYIAGQEAPVVKEPSSAQALDFDPEAAARTLRIVNQALRSKGLQPFLMSGTLLGCVRDGQILPHDKDVDIGIIGWENQFDVAQALVELGHFHINFDELKGERLFLFAPKDFRNQIAIDVFFYHDRGDHYLHGIDFQYGFTQNFRFSKFQLREVDFLGDKFWIPDPPERKLAENYGRDWRTPLPGYVVNVESPGLCDQGGLPHRVSAHLEVLKAMTVKKSCEKIDRILNFCQSSGLDLISKDIQRDIRNWMNRQDAE